MSTEKTSAIVLRVVDFSETSCVVTLFTEHFGKIGALAKGARRPKGPFDSALDLLTVCRIVFIDKSSDALDLLTEAKLERRFRAATRDLSRLYAGYYVAELLNELTDLGDPHPDLYHAADRTLQALDQTEPVAGHRPAVRGPDACGCWGTCRRWMLAPCAAGPVAAAGRVFFGQLAGGVLVPGMPGTASGRWSA